MKKLCLIFFSLISFSLHAQDSSSPFDIRLGLGASLFGDGDMRSFAVENELNYRLNSYLSTSASLGYGKSDNGVSITSSYIQGNLNAFFSPFGNNKKNDFRIGGGLSLISLSRVDEPGWSAIEGYILDENYNLQKYTRLGANVILENTYSITDRFMLGAKVYGQFYPEGSQNLGAMLKFGVRL